MSLQKVKGWVDQVHRIVLILFVEECLIVCEEEFRQDYVQLALGFGIFSKLEIDFAKRDLSSINSRRCFLSSDIDVKVGEEVE